MSVKALRRKRNTKNVNTKTKRFFIQFLFISIFFASLSYVTYHYREAILYYFSFKTNKKLKLNKIAQARIAQVFSENDSIIAGFDVSEYQGNINWKVIDSVENKKVSFVFIRATVGFDKIDSKFYYNWSQAQKTNLIFGAYHYFRPDEDAKLQAQLFIKTVKLKKGNLYPVLDIEKQPQNQSMVELKKELKIWLDLVEKKYKVKPIIYSGQRFYEDFLCDDFADYPFWIANYNFFAEKIKPNWQIWQFSEKGYINGVETLVDLNITNESQNKIKDLIISK